MKKPFSLIMVGAIALATPMAALAKEKSQRRTTKKRTVQTERTVTQEVITGVRPSAALPPGASGTTLGTASENRPSGDLGTGTTGVTRSTGVGIGEGTTLEDTGTTTGGAGITETGTLAPTAIQTPGSSFSRTVPVRTEPITTPPLTVPERVTIPDQTRVIPRATTNSGTIGAGTSTPVGPAPGR